MTPWLRGSVAPWEPHTHSDLELRVSRLCVLFREKNHPYVSEFCDETEDAKLDT